MKKYLLLILLLSINQITRAQQADNFLAGIRFPPTGFTEFRAGLLANSEKKYKNEKDTAWLLGANVYNIYFYFNKRVFVTSIHHKSEKIFMVKIVEWSDDSSPYFPNLMSRNITDTSLLYIDTLFTNELLKPYNDSCKADFNWHDIYEDSTDGYSSGCGFIPFPPNTMFEMAAYVKTNDRAAILRKCKSLFPNSQAWGALGLYVLKLKGMALTKEEEALFSKISTSTEIIYTCEGCISGVQKKLSELFTEKYLNTHFLYTVKSVFGL